MNDGSIALNSKIFRAKLLNTIRQFPADSIIAMEACATSYYWVRTVQSIRYTIRLIPTKHVIAFTKSPKNDANDALAICETVHPPGIHFVANKAVEQQDIKALRSARQLMVEQRVAIAQISAPFSVFVRLSLSFPCPHTRASRIYECLIP